MQEYRAAAAGDARRAVVVDLDNKIVEMVVTLEPVAAAYYYESTLDHDELVLTADFGGGTSDFCLMRMGPDVRRRGRRPDDMLGTDGVAVAGDALDARIIDHVVAPRLGAPRRAPGRGLG